MSANQSTSAKSASAKGKQVATVEQLRAAARAQLDEEYRFLPEGSIAGEEEFADFAHRVLEQLNIIGNGRFTEEVAHLAARLVRETAEYAVDVDGDNEESPWTHPIYREAFHLYIVERAAAQNAAAEEVAPTAVEVREPEVVEEEPAPRTRSQRKVAPRPVQAAKGKEPAKTAAKGKRARDADEGGAAPPAKKPKGDLPFFPEPVWSPGAKVPAQVIRCAYCALHPSGSRCVLRKGFAKCDKCILARQGCYASADKKEPFAAWYDGEGYDRAARLDGVVAAKVIRARGRKSDLPSWVKTAWETYKGDRKAAFEAGEGSLGESTESETSKPPSAAARKPATATRGRGSSRRVASTRSVAGPPSPGSAVLSHVEVPSPRARVAAPAAPQPSQAASGPSQPAARLGPRTPSPPPVAGPSTPASARTHSVATHPNTPASAPRADVTPPRAASRSPRQDSPPPAEQEPPLLGPEFYAPLPPIPEQPPLPPALAAMVITETEWYRMTLERHLRDNYARAQIVAAHGYPRSAAAAAFADTLRAMRDALSGQIAALVATRDDLRVRLRGFAPNDADIFALPENR